MLGSKELVVSTLDLYHNGNLTWRWGAHLASVGLVVIKRRILRFFCSAKQPEFRQNKTFVLSIPSSADLFFLSEIPNIIQVSFEALPAPPPPPHHQKKEGVNGCNKIAYFPNPRYLVSEKLATHRLRRRNRAQIAPTSKLVLYRILLGFTTVIKTILMNGTFFPGP
jgi:hypothetical protein